MKNRYLKLLESLNDVMLQDQNQDQNYNSKVLIVDSLNTFIRSIAVSTAVNDNGIHIGGLSGFLLSVGSAIKIHKPTRVILVFDGKGGSQRRRKLYPNYKGNRKPNSRITRLDIFSSVDEEKESMRQQLQRLVEYIENLPVHFISIDNVEADDVISYIATDYLPSESTKIIMSTDKDFLQLINNNTYVWSPTKKILYNVERFKEEFMFDPKNYIYYKTLIGDGSDNIPGIRGSGLPTVKKYLPMIFSNEDINIDKIYEYANENHKKSKYLTNIKNNKDLLDLNYKLMQLSDVNISGSTKSEIRAILNESIPRLVKFRLLQFFIEDKLNVAIKHPENWIRECWNSLDVYALQTHKK